jgi:predicted kinase
LVRGRSSSNPARFIAVSGPPCAGKSTLARELAARLGAPHLEVDEFRRRLLPRSDLRVEDRDVAYRAMHVTAELLASRWPHLVLDATYTAEPCRSELVEVVTRVRGVLSLVECRVTPTVADGRFRRRRSHPAHDLTSARVVSLAQAYPYHRGTLAIAADTRGGGIARVLPAVLDRSLDAGEMALWCASGLPREATAVRRPMVHCCRRPQPLTR